MISLKLQDGDLVLENGNLIMVENDEELAQSIRSVLQTRKGEFFLDPEHGTTWDNLLGTKGSQEEAKYDLIEALLQEERVASVRDIKFDKLDRKQLINLSVEKKDGSTLPIEEVEF